MRFPPFPIVSRHACASVALAMTIALGCGQTTESRLTEIQALQQIGDFSNSIAPLREILARDPDHPEANYLLGLALVQTRQPTLAIWPLRKAADSDDYQIVGRLVLASALLQTDGFEEAIEASSALLELDPSNIGGLLLRSDANLRIGQVEATLADAEMVLELDPEHPRALGTRAEALFRLGRFDESEKGWLELERALLATGSPAQAVRGCIAVAEFHHRRESDQFEPKLEACLDEYPGETFALQIASKHYDASGQPDKAIALWQRAVEEEPDRIDLRVQLGAVLSNEGRTEEAEAVLLEAAELFDDAQTWNRLAIFYQNHSRYEDALAAVDRSLARGTQAPELLFRKADLLVELDRLDEAEALSRDLDEVFRNMLQGRLLAARGDDRGALDALEAALTRWPNNPHARFLAGLISERLGMREKAIAQYREAVRSDPKATDAALRAAVIEMEDGNYAAARDFARNHVSNRPFNGPEAHVVGARSAAALGQFENARETLKELARTPGTEATVLVERAALERRATGSEAAVEVIAGSEIDLSDPARELALRSLVEDLVVLGRHDEAIAKAEAALAKNPESASYHDLLGRVLYGAGRGEEARRQFEQALEKDSASAAALAALARLELDEGRVDLAIASAEAALAADAGQNEAAYLLTQVLSRQGKADESKARLRALLLEQPDHVGAANDLAWQLAMEGQDLDEALALAQRAARLQPVANTLDTLGWVQLKRGDSAAAAGSFEQALKLDPNASSIRYRYGLALEELGRSDDAMHELREALGTGPFPEAEAARAEVARLEARAR
jgi:tetratricopeptide (TPR) repeat protein